MTSEPTLQCGNEETSPGEVIPVPSDMVAEPERVRAWLCSQMTWAACTSWLSSLKGLRTWESCLGSGPSYFIGPKWVVILPVLCLVASGVFSCSVSHLMLTESSQGGMSVIIECWSRVTQLLSGKTSTLSCIIGVQLRTKVFVSQNVPSQVGT